MLRRVRELFRRDSGTAVPTPESLVVGLGNPGPKYARTRHNIGFRVVERLAARRGGQWQSDSGTDSLLCHAEIAGKPIVLLAPQTFMNRSGESVRAALARWPSLEPTRDLIVVYDDLDLPTGRIRLRPSGGAGGHNGIGDILERLETSTVPRLRFGIGRPDAGEAVIDWVLADFTGAEEEMMPDAIDWAAEALEAMVEKGVKAAMDRFNRNRPDPI